MIPFVLTSCNTLCMNNMFLQRMPEKSRFWNTSGIIICLVKKWKVSDKLQLQFSKQNCYDVFMKDYKNLHSCSLPYSYWNICFPKAMHKLHWNGNRERPSTTFSQIHSNWVWYAIFTSQCSTWNYTSVTHAFQPLTNAIPPCLMKDLKFLLWHTWHMFLMQLYRAINGKRGNVTWKFWVTYVFASLTP